MKVFKNLDKVEENSSKKDIYYLNGRCPHNPNGNFCGSWCALFYINKASDDTNPYVILGCKTGQVRLYIEDIIGD